MCVLFRSQSLERPPAAAWLDHKHKELVSYCTLLQEHSHQCYVKGEKQCDGRWGRFGAGLWIFFMKSVLIFMKSYLRKRKELWDLVSNEQGFKDASVFSVGLTQLVPELCSAVMGGSFF